MIEIKSLLGVIATVLVFVGYIPYFRNILHGKTKPHIYSWFVWSVVALIIFALQVTGGAGAGALVTLAAAVMCILVVLLSFIYKSRVQIVKIDTVFLALAIIALGLWLVAKQPVLSATLATTVDLLAFVPTVRKTWNHPHSETVSFYFINTLRFGFAVLALQAYSIVTVLYPLAWLIVESVFAIVLIVRQKQIPSKK